MTAVSPGDCPSDEPAGQSLQVGTTVRLIRPVSIKGCYFAEGRRGKVILHLADTITCTVEFDDVYHTVAEIAVSDLAPVAIAYVREFSMAMLHWLGEQGIDYRLPRGAMFSPRRQHPHAISFDRAEDMALFCARWAASIVPPEAASEPPSRATPEAVTTGVAVDEAVLDEADDLWPGPDSPERAADIAQAIALRPQASIGGLCFEVYLPPGLAEWVLDLVIQGVFVDPSEAVFIGMGDYHELMPHIDLRKELVRRCLEAAINDPRPPIDGAEVFARLRKTLEEPLPQPAVWPRRSRAD